MAQEQEDLKKLQYPLNADSYKILDEIGVGVSAKVYKAICLPMNSTVIAIKAIDLDKSRADFDDIRRETKTMSLLSHPNILKAHCSFTVDRCLWVVMPFMSSGSLQSIISSSFPDGLSEPCIAVVLKETLNALAYLHNQGHLHRDIKAGNILVDSNGLVKLADFGVSASIYESTGYGPLASTSQLMLTDVAGTPYWMAPEVIHSHTGYSFKADIWSFGITALELAHGRPPLSHLPPSKSLLVNITKRFRFSDYAKSKDDKNKKFSKAFKDMVASCLDQDPAKRPTAEKLLKHSFFKNCKGADFLVKNMLHGLPNVEERFKAIKISHKIDGDDDQEEEIQGDSSKQRRISGWNFNEDVLQLDPVFPTDQKNDHATKQVRFGVEMIIQEKSSSSSGGGDSGESNPSAPEPEETTGPGTHTGEGDTSNLRAPEPEKTTGPEGTHTGEGSGDMNTSTETGNIAGEVGPPVGWRDSTVESLIALKNSLDDQKQAVVNIIGLFGRAVVSREDQLVQVIERLRRELEIERRKNSELEMEVEFLRMQISGSTNSTAID